MNETIGTPMDPTPEAPKKKVNTWLIVGIVAIVLCCCCVVGGYVMYQYLGDPLMQSLGIY